MLKGGGIEKRGGETKIWKKGGQAGSRDGCLEKKEGTGAPLQTLATAKFLNICLLSPASFTSFNPTFRLAILHIQPLEASLITILRSLSRQTWSLEKT